ncbi:MAG: acyl-CoA dehydratase activase [Peptostreptococcales bacterium]
MIGYVCKYTPIHIIKACGENPVLIEPHISNFDHADALLHSNMCTYSKAILEESIKNKIDKIILINCCDSIRRLYDVLKKNPNIRYIYLLDLPQKCNSCSKELFYKGIKDFILSLEEELHTCFDAEGFKKSLQEDLSQDSGDALVKEQINIALIGARYSQSLMDLIQQYDVHIKYNLTCANRSLDSFNLEEADLIREYSEQLLNQYPCMRMSETERRHEVLFQDKELDGIIYHTIKFCDYYGYDFANLKKKSIPPLLKIETDSTIQSEGQLHTRIEAFLESLNVRKASSIGPYKRAAPSPTHFMKDTTLVAGIDIGSTSTNVVLLDKNKSILASSIVKTGAKSIEAAHNALSEALSKAGLHRNAIKYIVSTGYGRISLPFADEEVTEITCHGKGAHFVFPSIRTIIDIGGQDSKAIKLDIQGNVKDFAMNDKCAAGTGRFLDMLTKTLDIQLPSIGQESLKWKKHITISSMCAVFAESEIISLIAKNTELPDILHGVCDSIAGKTTVLLRRIGGEPPYMMTGGVAKNIGIIRCLEDKLAQSIFVPEEPQIIGALGAALIAQEKYWG